MEDHLMGYAQELHGLDREIQEQVNLKETDADAARRFALELEELKADHQRTLTLVADLYTAGTGRSGVGPKLGVVEDVAEERHRLHRMIHILREQCVELSYKEIDDIAGEEPRCAKCNGYGFQSGQELVPVALKIMWPDEAGDPPSFVKIDAALASVGLRRV
jgi:hypothetical protein